MSFVIDRTKSYLRIEEPNLLSIYRSTSPVIPPDQLGSGRPCRAFICAAREYNLYRVFISLFDPQFKSNVIFTTDPIEPVPQKLTALIQEAHGFVAQMGFSMEEVDISFSAATREVVMKNCFVFREPAPLLLLEAAMAAVETLTAEKNDLARKLALNHQDLSAEMEMLKAQLRTMSATTVEKVEEPVPEEESNQDSQDTEARVAALEREAEVLRHAAADAKAACHLAQKSAKTSSSKVRVLGQTLKELNSAADASKAEVRTLKEQLGESTQAMLAAQKETGALRDQLETIQQTMANLQTTREAALERELSALKAELDRMQKQLDASKAAVSGELEALKAALLVSEENLQCERSKNESALQEMDALERNAAMELKKIKRTVDSLTDEKRLLESMASEFRANSTVEIERLKKENQSQRRSAIKKVAALKEEIRLLAEARAEMSTPFGPLSTPRSPASTQAPQSREVYVVAGRATEPISLTPFAGCMSTGDVNFLPDLSLPGIPYSLAKDVIMLYRSINRVQAAPDGGRMQNCDGVVALVRAEERFRVFAAWLMVATGEVLVCCPNRPCECEDEAQHLMHEGIGYFERVGLMMDTVELAPDPNKRQRQLREIPVFHHLALDHAA